MNLSRFYHTVRPLGWQQFWYRLWYPVKRRLFGNLVPPDENLVSPAKGRGPKNLFALPAFDRYNPANRSFTLLNIEQAFEGRIDWNYIGHGTLWRYHLNYFGWLNDRNLTIAERQETVKTHPVFDLIGHAKHSVAMDAYPVSIRGINVIRFWVENGLYEPLAARALYAQYRHLNVFPEYQIQGNHLWQNACSLLCAGLYFNEPIFYSAGKRMLRKAFKDQVLDDGGHVEGSPTYHSLLLCSVLQCLELSANIRSEPDGQFINELEQIAARMLGWARAIAFADGSWPHVNDAAEDVAPDLSTLCAFAKTLNIVPDEKALANSGYRKLVNNGFELFMDAGSIQPAWQPGHSHSDELSICLHVMGRPFLVDPGVQTYEPGAIRMWERSSDAHNVLSVAGSNASDVWKSFRVGKRAKVHLLQDGPERIVAVHDGYGFNYTRAVSLIGGKLFIEDTADCGEGEDLNINFHFARGIVPLAAGDGNIRAGNVLIKITHNFGALIERYDYSLAFNKTVPAWRLRIKACTHTITTLELENAD